MNSTICTDRTVRAFVVTIGLITVFHVLKELQAIFVPLVLALFLFFAFRPVNRSLARVAIRGTVAVLVNLLVVVAVVGGIVQLAATSFGQFAADAPRYLATVNRMLTTLASRWGAAGAVDISASVLAAKIDYAFFAGSLFSGTFSIAAYAVFVLFFYLFVVNGHETMLTKLRHRGQSGTALTGGVIETQLDRNIQSITEEITTYVVTKSAINLVAGVVCGLALALLGVESALLWGTCVFLFNYVPTVGSLAAMALPSIMALAQSGSPMFALGTAAAVLMLQAVAFNLVEPKVLGDRLGLNPLAILIALLLWGYVWGVVGMLLSVPLTAVIRIVLSGSKSEPARFFADLLGN